MSPLLSTAILRAQSDERLVALAREGHERAFEALVERYRRPLVRHVRRVLPESRAEDAVQQAFLNAWSAVERGVEVREPRAWLYRVSQNAALNVLRGPGYEYEELRDSLRAPGAGPAEDHERRRVIRRTLSGLASLPENQREALLRTAVEGQSHEQVAEALGLTEGAVRGLVYRARASLRAAATALTPAPLLGWAVAFASGGAPGSSTERIAEIVAGGGSASVGAVLVKAGAVVAVTGAVAGGAVAVRDAEFGRDGGDAQAEAVGRLGKAAGAGAISGAPGTAGRPVLAGGGARGERHGRDERGRHGRGGDDHGRNRGHGGRDDASADRTERRSDSSGSGSSGSGSSGSGSSGSGSSGSGSSGSNSGSSGSGSSDSSGSSGSGSSGSGSNSGPGSDSFGSGSSGSASSGSSGPGPGETTSSSSGPGPGPTLTVTTTTTTSGSGPSGSGSSDSGTSGSGSSGSGSSGSGSSGGPGG